MGANTSQIDCLSKNLIGGQNIVRIYATKFYEGLTGPSRASAGTGEFHCSGPGGQSIFLLK